MLRYLGWIKTAWKWRVFFRDRLRQVKAAADFIADELDANAKELSMERYVQSPGADPYRIRTEAWHEHRATLHALGSVDPAVWAELQAAYAALEGHAEDRPKPEQLGLLAEKLRAAMPEWP